MIARAPPGILQIRWTSTRLGVPGLMGSDRTGEPCGGRATGLAAVGNLTAESSDRATPAARAGPRAGTVVAGSTARVNAILTAGVPGRVRSAFPQPIANSARVDPTQIANLTHRGNSDGPSVSNSFLAAAREAKPEAPHDLGAAVYRLGQTTRIGVHGLQDDPEHAR